jgi:DNA replication and repair protein RecF
MNNKLTSLRLQQYRSYDDFAVELSPTVNIVVGPNASGKTNLLESVLLLCGGNTYRASIYDVVMHNKDWSRVEAMLVNRARSLSIDATGDLIKKKYTINDVQRQRLRYEDIIPVVLFEPEDMRLLTGSPEERRNFLDDILGYIDPQYNTVKKQYNRVLLQRNSLLKNSNSGKDQFFIWNIRLSELAGYIVESRTKLVDILNSKISDMYSEIAGKKSKVLINYVSSIPINSYESSLMKALENNLQKDIERGFTAYGPHRDDFTVELKGVAAKTTASRGETRTLVLSLKLLQVTLIEEKRGISPLVLLDDVFSELDGSRRKALTMHLTNHQTIITTTDADIIAKDFAQHATTISL